MNGRAEGKTDGVREEGGGMAEGRKGNGKRRIGEGCIGAVRKLDMGSVTKIVTYLYVSIYSFNRTVKWLSGHKGEKKYAVVFQVQQQQQKKD